MQEYIGKIRNYQGLEGRKSTTHQWSRWNLARRRPRGNNLWYRLPCVFSANSGSASTIQLQVGCNNTVYILSSFSYSIEYGHKYNFDSLQNDQIKTLEILSNGVIIFPVFVGPIARQGRNHSSKFWDKGRLLEGCRLLMMYEVYGYFFQRRLRIGHCVTDTNRCRGSLRKLILKSVHFPAVGRHTTA